MEPSAADSAAMDLDLDVDMDAADYGLPESVRSINQSIKSITIDIQHRLKNALLAF